MNNYTIEKLLPELKIIRLILQLYTILHLVVLGIFFTNIIGHNFNVIFGINIIFILTFLSFLWFRLPMSKYEKIGETLLILIFGLFAIWMWIPNEKGLKKMISEYNSKHNITF